MTAPLSATRGAIRVLRGTGLAVCCAVLGVTGHMAAGATAPPAGPTVLFTVLLAAAGITLADRQRHPLTIAGAVAGTQLGMHLLLSALAHRHPVAPGGSTFAMFVAHAAATLIMAWLLVGAERAVFALVALLYWLLHRVSGLSKVGPVAGAPVVMVLPATPTTATALQQLLVRINARRGPPALS